MAEAVEVRCQEADWSFIMSQPPKIAKALIYLIETENLLASAKTADMNLVEFD